MTGREAGRSRHGERRTTPVGRRIALLLVIPLVSLLALWGFTAATTLSDAVQRRDYSTLYDHIGNKAGALVAGVQRERTAAVAALTAPGTATTRALREVQAGTDAMAKAFREVAHDEQTRDAMPAATVRQVSVLEEALDGLGGLRDRAAARELTPLEAIDGYSALSDSAFRLLGTIVSVDDVRVYRNLGGLLDVFLGQDFVLREDALLTALRVRRATAADRAAFARWQGSGRDVLARGVAGLDGDIAAIVQRLFDDPTYQAYRALEERYTTDGTIPEPAAWKAAVTGLSPVWLEVATEAGLVVNKEMVDPVRRAILVRLALAGGLGLLAVIGSTVLSVLFARRLGRELRDLQRSAQELAHVRLPRVVARLRAGEKVDVEAEAPRPPAGRTQEIALVAEAFAAVRRTAIGTAISEADLRSGISSVFVNLSWRSQSLLHRQLRLLDQMERRASSPEELEDLFRLDHLTTRMRRHAEGLVILSGSPTVRAWDHPVPAEDLVRAAIAEVEDYQRVEVVGSSQAAVGGAVVADVIHLLAELIENAAAFSPPGTEVTVKIVTVANGLAVEIVDRGIGVHRDELAALNQRLAAPVEFDLVDTDRLGLFVVARLASRHGIRVVLQPSAYGGTTAVVLIPHTLVVTAPAAVRVPEPPRALPAEPVYAPGHSWSAPEPAAARSAPGSPPGDELLPRRVRRQSLAEPLRGAPPAPPQDPPIEDDPDPELSRSLMDSLQSGWLRGRAADEDDRTGPGEETGRS